MVWWNYFTYSSIGIRRKGATRVVRFQSADGKIVEHGLTSKDSSVILLISCGEKYQFGFQETESSASKKESKWIGEVSNRVMTRSPPVGASYTGMMLGVYAFGERQRCLDPADFSYVEFRP